MQRFHFVVLILMALATSQLVASDTIEIATGTAPNHPQQPQLACDDAGNLHVIYGSGNRVLYSQLAKGATRIRDAVPLPVSDVIALGMRRGPRIAVSGKSICVSLIGGQQGRGRDGDVLGYRSTDGGRTWSGPVHVNDESGSAREGLHAMAAAPNGQLCCVWLDLRNKKMEIFASLSSDGGETWGKNLLVYKSPDGSVCECCHPSVTYDSQGKLYVMWRNSLAGARDMYLSTSTDGGKTFSSAAKLGTGTWPLKACPMDGGFLAIAPNGNVTTTWRRETQIYVTRPDGTEQLLGVGRQPWIAATSAGNHILWVTQKHGQLKYLAPHQTAPMDLAPVANDPVVIAGPQGVVAAWEEKSNDKTSLVLKKLAES